MRGIEYYGRWWCSAAGVVIFAVGCASRGPLRPSPDNTAMKEVSAEYHQGQYVSGRAYAHFLKGMVASHKNDYQAAIDELKQAIVYDQEADCLWLALAEQYDHLGDSHLANARPGEAMRAYQRALQLLKQSPDAKVQASIEKKLDRLEARKASDR